MPGNKTVPNKASVNAFLQAVQDPIQRADSFKLMELMQDITGEPPVMWGPSIVGFGKYHYRYDSGREGDMPVVGFSPRKGKLSLYIGGNAGMNKSLLEILGPCKTGKSCLYIKRLENVDLEILGRIVTNTYQNLNNKYNL